MSLEAVTWVPIEPVILEPQMHDELQMGQSNGDAMLDIGKILVPVDFSDASEKALNYGFSLARVFEADLLITNIIQHGFLGSRPERAEYAAEVRTKLEGFVPENTRGLVDCKFIVEEGTAADTLLALSRKVQANLIVMGTHGRRAFARWLLGSVAEHLLQHVSVPVVTVSHSVQDEAVWTTSPKRILYATDFSSDSVRGLDLAGEWARRFEAELSVLHVMPPWTGLLSTHGEQDQSRLRENLSKQLEQFVPKQMQEKQAIELALREGVPYQSILDVANEKEIDLIVVNLHGRNRVERTLLGSTAERVIRGAQQPVLSVPAVEF